MRDIVVELMWWLSISILFGTGIAAGYMFVRTFIRCIKWTAVLRLAGHELHSIGWREEVDAQGVVFIEPRFGCEWARWLFVKVIAWRSKLEGET